MHRAVAELGDEIDGQQVEVTANETAQTKLAAAVFPLLMMHHLFAYMTETVHLGDDRDITVHLAIHLDVFHHLVAIGLKATVEVVQLDARHAPCGPVEELRWDVFHQLGVVTHFLPARYKVVTVFLDHLVKLRDFVGAVL